MDSSAPSILPPRVQVPSTPSMLFSINNVQIVNLSFELECENNENKQKEEGIGTFLKIVKYLTDLVETSPGRKQVPQFKTCAAVCYVLQHLHHLTN